MQVVGRPELHADADAVAVHVVSRAERGTLADGIRALDEDVGRAEGELLGADRVHGEEADVRGTVADRVDRLAGGVPEDQLDGHVQTSAELVGDVDGDACGVLGRPVGQDRVAEVDRGAQHPGGRKVRGTRHAAMLSPAGPSRHRGAATWTRPQASRAPTSCPTSHAGYQASPRMTTPQTAHRVTRPERVRREGSGARKEAKKRELARRPYPPRFVALEGLPPVARAEPDQQPTCDGDREEEPDAAEEQEGDGRHQGDPTVRV